MLMLLNAAELKKKRTPMAEFGMAKRGQKAEALKRIIQSHIKHHQFCL